MGLDRHRLFSLAHTAHFTTKGGPSMALDIFLKIDSIEGESQDKKHAKEVDVLAWSWGVSQSGSFHSGGGGGAGKASFQDLSFTKYTDKATTKLLKAVSSGQHIKDAVLTVRKSGGDEPVEYLIITMTEVMITNYSTGASGGEDRITENCTLNFAKVETKYTPQSGTGGGGSAMTFGWNIKENTKL
jgi:type VI secretion system secreted protein Hcp